ncbi:defensin-like protein 242 isoform X2 [Raphanus sativus]|uniref:Defensin-like protein 242 isoform X2 n=1 Tax=Raphanus sativus TaxID=3726 RepID=A0A9W3C9R0_RAPSA|nr:defensin-like protein 242 isoform X2 [Raphanus sativus]
MKFAAVLLVSFVLFSLIDAHFSQEPVYCRSRQMFNGSCTDRGSSSATCFLDFLGARSASEMPKNCHCTPKPKNMRLCECQVVCTDCCN